MQKRKCCVYAKTEVLCAQVVQPERERVPAAVRRGRHRRGQQARHLVSVPFSIHPPFPYLLTFLLTTSLFFQL